MSLAERLRAIGVSQERIARFADPAPTVAAVVRTAATLADPQAVADLELWRSYSAETDAFKRTRMRTESHEAIERGRQIAEMK
jgi:hypothetical protein